MVTREQIERFFKFKSSPQEADAVARYFEEHPEELDLYFSDEEWEAFRANNSIHVDKAAAILTAIRRNTIYNPHYKKRIYIKYAVAAAVVGLLAFAGWQFLLKRTAGGDANPAVATKFIENTGREVMLVMLPDSSAVYLTPASAVSFEDPFQSGRRMVTLTGEASFDVRKDSRRPFTVKTDDIATNVLGTQFSVRSFKADNTIKVALFSGYVAVGNADSLHPVLQNMFYLSPGDVLIYDKSKKSAVLKTARRENKEPKNSEEKISAGGRLQDNNWYMFNNQPLSGVFDQLELLYNQKIIYSEKDLKGLLFIGRVDKSDTLETILDLIGRLNDLEVIRRPDGFLIKKAK